MNYTNDQETALVRLKNFFSFDNNDKFFILKGSAGTGKTTLLKTIYYELASHFDHISVTAPTHKAAKVIRHKAQISAGTIHSLLYTVEPIDENGKVRLVRKVNRPGDPILYIVDEVSMVSDRVNKSEQFEINTPLLNDLITFVLQGNSLNKIVFVGDPCQIPPIGYDISESSPGLDEEYLKKTYNIPGSSFQLNEVVRQAGNSYILKSANFLRDHILYKQPLKEILSTRMKNSYAAMDMYMKHFDENDESIISLIARTNISVNRWNNWVRDKRGFTDLPLQEGDCVIVDRPWSNDEKILIRGDAAHVMGVSGITETFAGLNFMKAKLRFSSVDGPFEIDTLYVIDHLNSEKGWLTGEQEKKLVHEAIKNNPKYRLSKSPIDDKYINAIRLRYAYALTGHKAQGSEYNHVILHPFRATDNPKWLYTAVTRAKKELYTYQ